MAEKKTATRNKTLERKKGPRIDTGIKRYSVVHMYLGPFQKDSTVI
jgi:hypothetical protein